MSLYAIEIPTFTNEMSIPAGSTGWTPAETDKVVVSLGGHGIPDANIPIRVVWHSGTSTWKIHSDDTSGNYTGKLQVIIKTSTV